MANLRDQFAPYYTPGKEVVAGAVRTGLVTPDTNVLLAAYRASSGRRVRSYSVLLRNSGTASGHLTMSHLSSTGTASA
jgi:hypothetical protein